MLFPTLKFLFAYCHHQCVLGLSPSLVRVFSAVMWCFPAQCFLCVSSSACCPLWLWLLCTDLLCSLLCSALLLQPSRVPCSRSLSALCLVSTVFLSSFPLYVYSFHFPRLKSLFQIPGLFCLSLFLFHLAMSFIFFFLLATVSQCFFFPIVTQGSSLLQSPATSFSPHLPTSFSLLLYTFLHS